ncbi:MAG: radical SAM protein [bacterium]|nr:radical SAM protein [bacterium]
MLKRMKPPFYVAGADEHPLRDVAKRVAYRRVPQFPRTVQIETVAGCNGSCVFCPISNTDAVVPKGSMPQELFEKVVEEIGHAGCTRRISPYLTNEPFLDPQIVERSRFIRRIVQGCDVVITTNAGLVRPTVVDDIVRDNPFHAIYVSMQGIDKGAYEQSMGGGLVFEDTLRNVEYLVEQRNRHLPSLKIMITMVNTSEVDVDKAIRYWADRGVPAKATVLEDRGGSVGEFDNLRVNGKRIFRNCSRLLKAACITFDGEVVLCCADYYRSVVLGNIRDNTLADVWNSERAVGIRRGFLRGKPNPLCAHCNLDADGSE